ncbi:MAG: TonB-dependent receptor [Bacteroidota bacterium]
MRKLFTLVSALFLMLCSFEAYGQKTITGQVNDENGPLPGASVLIKGTTVGAFTNAQGFFSLEVPDNNAVLLISFLGKVSQEIVVGTDDAFSVTMVNDAMALEEVIITGFGSTIKRDLTGNIAKVDGKDIENVPVTSFESALQGRAAGVFVSKQNGKLGNGINIRIRGSASVTASNEPLYVVDGIVITSDNQSSIIGVTPTTPTATTSPLADLNFNDIESIEILKDASAAAIYGSRASNGVVIITTKQGAAGKTNFNVGYSIGFSEPSRRREWLNGQEYTELWEEAFNNVANADGLVFGLSANEWRDRRIPGWDQNNDTDWQEEAFDDDAGFQQIDINASGGTDRTRFYISGSMLDQVGIMIGNDFERFSGRLNLDHQTSDNIKIGMKLSLARTINGRVSSDNSFATPLQLVALPPVQPKNDPDNPEELFDRTVYFNGLLFEDNVFQRQTVFRSLGNVYFDWQFLSSLSFRTEFGVDFLSQNEETYFNSRVARSTGQNNGRGENTFRHVLNYSTNNYFTYNQLFGEHSVNAVLGMSFQESTNDFAQVAGINFPNDDFRKLASAAEINEGTSIGTIFNIVSYFIRANYKFQNKYLVSASARIDGDSRFGEDERYGFFPSASVGWILSEESFLSENPVLSFLKLRASYGVTGNTPIANFPSRGLWGGAAAYGGNSGISPTQVKNPDLKWENTTQIDIGIDFGFFDDRISGEVDYYVKNTDDLLLNVNVPSTTGFATQLRNVGELQNSGFEFVLNSENLIGDFRWSTSLNFAANTNEITDLQGQIIEGGFINRAVEGQAIGVFFAPEYAGVDPENGDALYYLNTELADGGRDRNTTNNINDAERVVIGDPNPDFIYGMNNTFSWKGIDLAIFIQGVQGNDIYNGGGFFQLDGFGWFDNQDKRVLDRWQQPGDQTDIPQLRFLGGSAESSRFLSDGSYLRLKTVTLGYTLPQSITSRVGIDKVRLYATGQNLAIWTDYEGWDPEVNADYIAGNIGLGNDFYSGPQARTIVFGASVGF